MRTIFQMFFSALVLLFTSMVVMATFGWVIIGAKMFVACFFSESELVVFMASVLTISALILLALITTKKKAK